MDECVRVLDRMPERNPTEGTFELTIRCNLHCKMCLFRHDDSENAEIMAKELTAEQWIDMARQVAEAGTLSLLITGGEPMLRPDFCEIWEGIYKLVTPKIMETLRKYPPHKIGVTIYGAGPETYEKVTGSAAAFEKAIEGIRQLKTLPSQMEYRMTVIKDNYDDVAAVENLVSRFDPEALLINAQLVTKGVRGACADVDSCRLDPGEYIKLSVERGIRELKTKLGARFSEGTVSIIKNEPECDSSSKEGVPTLFGCQAGMKSYTISWDGKLLGCQIMGSFAQETNAGFQKAWDDFPYGVSLPPVCDTCHHCPLSEYCSLCAAFRFAETGTFTEAPSYICKKTKKTYQFLSENGIVKEKHAL